MRWGRAGCAGISARRSALPAPGIGMTTPVASPSPGTVVSLSLSSILRRQTCTPTLPSGQASLAVRGRPVCNTFFLLGTRTGVPRSQRLCPLCQAPYSDERHTLLECTAMSLLREKYQQLFCPHVSMRQFMWQNDLPQLARFVIECLQFLAAAQSTG